MSVSVAVVSQRDGPHLGSYLTTLALMKRVEKLYLCDPSGESFPLAKQEFGDRLAGTYRDLDECLAQGPFAFVLVSLDNRSAPEAIARALEAGNHVFTEKTAARNGAEFAPLVALAAKKQRLLGMSYPNRFRPSVQEARRLVNAGALGKLYGFYVQSVATRADLRNPPGSWMFRKNTAGGGYLIWLGCHYLDLLRYITGDEVDTVAAMSGHASEIPFDVEDAIALSMRLRSGAVGAANFGYYLGPDRKFGSKQSQIMLWGKLGWIELQPGEDDEVPIEVYSMHPDFLGASYRRTSFALDVQPKAYGSGWGLAFLERFLSACLGEAETPITASDSEAVIRVIDAAYRSAEEGRVVPVDA